MLLQKTIQAKNFDECLPKMISHETAAHPDKPHDQIVAIAASKCRVKFPGSSKAEIARNIELSEILDPESRNAFVKMLKKTFEKKDWIDYSLLLRSEGLTTLEVAEKIVFKESWVKKHINPVFREVTKSNEESRDKEQLVISEAVTPENYRLQLINLQITDIQKKERTFEGWGSVEVRDSQGDIVGIEGLEKVMPIVMIRGGVIMFSHSNRHVGRLLKYKFKDKIVNGKSIPAVWLKGQIFNHYQIDDEAWNIIQLAVITGDPVLSLGGTPLLEKFECTDDICFRRVEDLQVYEWSVVDLGTGSKGSNPEATIESAIEKQEQVTKVSELKPEDSELIDLLLASNTTCQSDYLSYIEKGSTEKEAKHKLLNEFIKETEELELLIIKEDEIKLTPDEDKDKDKTKDQTEPAPPVAPVIPPGEEGKQGEDLAQNMAQMLALIQKIAEKILGAPEEEEPAPAAPAAPEEAAAEAETPLVLNKVQIAELVKSDDFKSVLVELGYKAAETTPAPTQTRAKPEDLQKGGVEKGFPTTDEIREARQQGTLDDLSAKYGYPI